MLILNPIDNYYYYYDGIAIMRIEYRKADAFPIYEI